MQNGHANSVPPGMEQFENIRLMNWIAQEMREIPILDSEKPRDSNPINKVEFPEEGGILTFMGGFDYPYKGFPLAEFVEKIDTIKKISRASLSGLFHSLKGKNRFLLLLSIPSIWLAKDAFYAGVYTFYRLIERFRIKSIRYSKMVREMHRALNIPRNKEEIKTLELRLMLKDLVCMLLEFDNAYRYRFQDIIVELNKENLKLKPIKELNRLLDIISEREKTQELKDTWRLIRMAINYYLRFDKKVLNMVVDVLNQINLDEVKLSIEDKYFCAKRFDYEFGFMKEPAQEDIDLMVKEKKAKEHTKIRLELDEKLGTEVQDLTERHRKEQESAIYISAELQKKIQNEIIELQTKSNEEFHRIPKEIPLKYLTQEQKDLIAKQGKEMNKLLMEHDKKRGQLAASYGL